MAPSPSWIARLGNSGMRVMPGCDKHDVRGVLLRVLVRRDVLVIEATLQSRVSRASAAEPFEIDSRRNVRLVFFPQGLADIFGGWSPG